MNFIILGVLAILFAFGFGRALSFVSGRKTRATSKSVLLFGIMIILAGAFLLFAADAPGGDVIPLYYAHTTVSLLAFLLIIAAQFFAWRTLRKSNAREWSTYRNYSLASGLLSVLFLCVFLFTMFSTIQGATERMFAAVPLVWMEISGIKIYEFAKPTPHSYISLNECAVFLLGNIRQSPTILAGLIPNAGCGI